MNIPKEPVAAIKRIREESKKLKRLSKREQAECDFTDWIAAMGGPTEVARALKVSRSTIYSWTCHQRRPKEQMMKRIVKVADGMLDLATIKEATAAAGDKKPGRPSKAELKRRKAREAQWADLLAHKVSEEVKP